ncbi:hypothetical protein [Paenibacillus artemisiicola]|uniref:hypothetical protein n=1 Tax=Paenibacillus artemisiicola TaxID=1172618 RepID=UPI001F0AF06B|nr:hypothetical protein [Paenibacillus artemisiicola]
MQLTWENILALTRNYLQHDLHVIVDFVEEEELNWFCKHLSDLKNVSLIYVVLRADKETIIERLKIRGDVDSLERSLFLLNKIDSSPFTNKFSYDTTLKQPLETVQEIITSTRSALTPQDIDLNTSGI